MKIAKPLRDAFENSEEWCGRLKNAVRDVLRPKVEERSWFYIDRLKQIESFALKVETGRVPDLRNLEDFFACTIIVPTLSDIEPAERLVGELYETIRRRPEKDSETHKHSSDFTFDDLRLYVHCRTAPDGRSSGLEGIVFEVQIKTVLQYAWGIATHELIYKTDEVSWPKQRIAFQVKAMLEHAELAIAEAERLSSASAVAKQDRRTRETLKIIEQVRPVWHGDTLPTDLKRMAESIAGTLSAGDIPIDRLADIIESEKRRIGLVSRDLSPYAFVVQAVTNHPDLDFERKFKRRHVRTTLVIHDDMELPAWVRAGHERVINLGPASAAAAVVTPEASGVDVD
jgi:ppGpp synthetase/RelA/SpoT-type nucleotidyltranferase